MSPGVHGTHNGIPSTSDRTCHQDHRQTSMYYSDLRVWSCFGGADRTERLRACLSGFIDRSCGVLSTALGKKVSGLVPGKNENTYAHLSCVANPLWSSECSTSARFAWRQDQRVAGRPMRFRHPVQDSVHLSLRSLAAETPSHEPCSLDGGNHVSRIVPHKHYQPRVA